MTRIRLRFRGSSLIAAYRVPVSGNPNLARNCQLRPLGFIKGTAIRSLVHLSPLSLSLFSRLARECVNRVAARLARERAQARFPWSHCRRPAKEAASLIGIPTRSLLLSPPLCVVGRVGPSALFYDRVYAMWTNWSDGAKIFHKDFLFLFFLSRGKGGKEEKWRTIFDNYDNGIFKVDIRRMNVSGLL